MDYKNIGKQIMDIDPDVRFVTIFDINDNIFLFSEHRARGDKPPNKRRKQAFPSDCTRCMENAPHTRKKDRKRKICTC